MGKKLYVGNLAPTVTETVLRDAFAGSGTVTSVRILSDRYTKASRGFGFVEMSTDAEAAKGIADFHGREVEGRALTVNEARPQTSSPPLNTDNYSGGIRGDRGRY